MSNQRVKLVTQRIREFEAIHSVHRCGLGDILYKDFPTSHSQQLSLLTPHFSTNLIQDTMEGFLFSPPHQRGQPQVSLMLVDDPGPKHVPHLFFNLLTRVLAEK